MNIFHKSAEYQITKEDIRALKLADAICFDVEKSGTTGIRAIKRDVFDQSYSIDTGAIVEAYHYQPIGKPESIRCYGYVGSCQYHEAWKTIVSLLRVGDRIMLDFSTCEHDSTDRGNYASAMVCELLGYEEQWLYNDRMSLKITRDNGKELTFHLISSITPNNSARMIQYR